MGLFNNWFKSREDKLLDQIFNLKFTAKQLARTAAKCEKEEKQLWDELEDVSSSGSLGQCRPHNGLVSKAGNNCKTKDNSGGSCAPKVANKAACQKLLKDIIMTTNTTITIPTMPITTSTTIMGMRNTRIQITPSRR